VRLANLVLNFLVVAISALCIVGILASDWIVRALAPGFANVPGKIELTAMMTRIMTPFLLLVSLAAACMGFLNTRRVFFIPALAPTMLNLGLILAGYLIAPLMPRFGLEPIVGMAFGALLGGLGQMLIQVPWMKAQGFRWEPIVNFKDPDVLRMVTLMAPAALGIAAAQVNIFVSTFLASQLQQGSVSWLNYAYRLMQLPIGLFGVAIATVTLAEVAKHAAQKNMVVSRRRCRSRSGSCSSSRSRRRSRSSRLRSRSWPSSISTAASRQPTRWRPRTRSGPTRSGSRRSPRCG
jgi:putative peptidoglycan lipid II flippase